MKDKLTWFNTVKSTLFLKFNNKERIFLLYKLSPRLFPMVIVRLQPHSLCMSILRARKRSTHIFQSFTTWFNVQVGSENLIISTKKPIFYAYLLRLKYFFLIIPLLYCRKYGMMLGVISGKMFLFKELIDYKLYLKICLIVALLWQLQQRDWSITVQLFCHAFVVPRHIHLRCPSKQMAWQKLPQTVK